MVISSEAEQGHNCDQIKAEPQKRRDLKALLPGGWRDLIAHSSLFQTLHEMFLYNVNRALNYYL